MPLRETCIAPFLPRPFCIGARRAGARKHPLAPAARLAAGWAMPQRRPWPHALAISVAAGLAVALLGTTPLMGLPGAFLLILADPFLRRLSRGDNLFPRDSAWPFALALTWLLGALLPVAWLSTRRWSGAARGPAFLLL